MQAAPEEDLKHVFDVLDKSSSGQITADSLRSAIKVSLPKGTSQSARGFACVIENAHLHRMAGSAILADARQSLACQQLAANECGGMYTACCHMLDLSSCICLQSIGDWEMTDDEIDIAIKLADKSGDGIIDYDEFIAFVFGDNDTAQPQPGADSAQPVASTSHAELTEVKTSDWVDPNAQQSAQPNSHVSHEPTASSSAHPLPPWLAGDDMAQVQKATASSAPPWLAANAGPDTSNAETDDWVTAQAHDTAMPSNASTVQPHSLYDNAVYQPKESDQPEPASAEHVLQQRQHQQQQTQWQQQLLQPDADTEQHNNPSEAGFAAADVSDRSSAPDLLASTAHEERQAYLPGTQQAYSSDRQHADEVEGPFLDSHTTPPADSAEREHAASSQLSAPTYEQQLQHPQLDYPGSWLEADGPAEQSDSFMPVQTDAHEAIQQQGEGVSQLQADDDHAAQVQAAAPAKPPSRLPPLPKGRKPGTLPKHPLPSSASNKRQLPGLSTSQLSAGVNRAKQQPS